MDLSQAAPASQEPRWALQYCGAKRPDGAAVGIPPALSEKRVIRASLLDESTGPTSALSRTLFEASKGRESEIATVQRHIESIRRPEFDGAEVPPCSTRGM